MQQPGSVLQRAAVLVCPLVGGQQELVNQIPVGRIDIDDVETGPLGTACRLDMPALQLPDVGFVHRPGLDRIIDTGRNAGRAERDLARIEVCAGGAAVPQLDTGESAMGVDLVDHERVPVDVLVIPQGGGGIRLVVRRRMNRAVLGAHRAPPPFRLHLAQRSEGPGPPISHARAVGNLVEAVWRRHRSDANRLEENIESGIARHLLPPMGLMTSGLYAGRRGPRRSSR